MTQLRFTGRIRSNYAAISEPKDHYPSKVKGPLATEGLFAILNLTNWSGLSDEVSTVSLFSLDICDPVEDHFLEDSRSLLRLKHDGCKLGLWRTLPRDKVDLLDIGADEAPNGLVE